MFIKGGFLPEGLENVFANKNILEIMEQIGLGKNIAGHPAWNLRCKTPKYAETTITWH